VTTERPDLVELGRYAYGRLRNRLEGLTDEELAWKPAPGVTGLAWRLQHIAALLTDDRNAQWLGVPSAPSSAGSPQPRSAAEALGMLDAAFRCWQGVLDAVPEESLDVAVGPVGGPYADSTRRAFVLHVLDELIHHGAEVALVRDLWSARQAGFPTAR
jgi:DinB superfamily